MQFRRVVENGGTRLEVRGKGGWSALEPGDDHGHPDLVRTLRENPPRTFPAREGEAMLPFQPLAYRDFMLYERHYIQAARGFLKRFRPAAYRVVRGYEAVTGRVFPPLKPPPLWYREPIYYFGNHLRFISDGAEIAWPRYSRALDYELELGFLLVRPLLDAAPDEALAAIGGFVVFNDVSARDVQRPEMLSGFGPQKSKHFCNAISAVLVSADVVLPHLDHLHGRVVINGRTVAECRSTGARWTLGQALAHASRGERLEPGEFFATGTWPNGTGIENGEWLQPGDTLRLEIDGVGSLTNTIVRKH